MISVHARLAHERSETVQGDDEDDFADSEQDDLSRTTWLGGAKGDASHERDEDRNEGERCSAIAVGVVERTVKEHGGHVVKEMGARFGREDDSQDPDGRNDPDC